MQNITLLVSKPQLKLILNFFLLLFCSSLLYSQTINIPDPVLKQRLLDYDNPVIDTNGDGEIQISEAEAITSLTLNTKSSSPELSFDDATGLEYFVNLNHLNLRGNNFTSIDLSSMINLEYLALNKVPLDILDTSFNLELKFLYIPYTSLSKIDVSNNPNLISIVLYESNQLNYINIKNGNTDGINFPEGLAALPNLQMICVDDVDEFLENLYANDLDDSVIITTDCDFDPNTANTITGETKIDYGPGCNDPSSFGIPNIIIKSETNGDEFATLTNQDGVYTLYTKSGENNVGAVLANPPYWEAAPDSYNFNFIGIDNSEIADFCMESTEDVEDLNVAIFGPCPGFYLQPYVQDVQHFLLTVENMGTEMADGEVILYHSEDFFHYDPTTQSAISQPENGVVHLSFSDLKPFHQETFPVYLSVIPEHSVEPGDFLEFSAHVTPDENDYTPEDNIYTTEVMVFSLNSTNKPMMDYYSNNKRVMEGEEVHIDDADQYLHYLINFQNTGNTNVDYVKVVDTLSDKLDWTTFRLSYASHDYRVEIKNDSIFTIIFEDIDIAYEDADEDESHGYIAYKVKPKSDVEVDDIIGSQAHIFLEEDPVIITNLPTTTFVKNFSAEKEESNENLKLYPNPTSGEINLHLPQSTDIKEIAIRSLDGRLIDQLKPADRIDLSHLANGIYFISLKDTKGHQVTKRIIKK